MRLIDFRPVLVSCHTLSRYIRAQSDASYPRIVLPWTLTHTQARTMRQNARTDDACKSAGHQAVDSLTAWQAVQKNCKIGHTFHMYIFQRTDITLCRKQAIESRLIGALFRKHVPPGTSKISIGTLFQRRQNRNADSQQKGKVRLKKEHLLRLSCSRNKTFV